MTDNAVDILKKIRGGSLDPKEISITNRQTCVAYLRFEGYTQDEIAEIFGVHRRTIMRDEKIHRKEVAKLVDEIDVKSTGGGLIALSRQLVAKALRKKDYGLAWKIQRELINDLQNLGYLPRSPERHQVQVGTFVDLVEMAAKQVDGEIVEADSKNKLQSAPNNSNVDGAIQTVSDHTYNSEDPDENSR